MDSLENGATQARCKSAPELMAGAVDPLSVWRGRSEILLIGRTVRESVTIRDALTGLPIALQAASTTIEGIDGFRRQPRALVVLDMEAGGLPWRRAVRSLRAINPLGRIVLSCRSPELALEASDAGLLVLNRPLEVAILQDLLEC